MPSVSGNVGLATDASVTGHWAQAKRVRRRVAGAMLVRKQGGAMAELADAASPEYVALLVSYGLWRRS